MISHNSVAKRGIRWVAWKMVCEGLETIEGSKVPVSAVESSLHRPPFVNVGFDVRPRSILGTIERSKFLLHGKSGTMITTPIITTEDVENVTSTPKRDAILISTSRDLCQRSGAKSTSDDILDNGVKSPPLLVVGDIVSRRMLVQNRRKGRYA